MMLNPETLSATVAGDSAHDLKTFLGFTALTKLNGDRRGSHSPKLSLVGRVG
jgi:hypothetical protein